MRRYWATTGARQNYTTAFFATNFIDISLGLTSGWGFGIEIDLQDQPARFQICYGHETRQ